MKTTMIRLWQKLFFLKWLMLVKLCCAAFDADLPCASHRPVPENSVVCVCNASYCDTVTREPPPLRGYFVYTSSESGLRFKKSQGSLKAAQAEQWNKTSPACVTTLELDPTVLYQEVSGFGGAVTDAAAMNLFSLEDPQTRHHLIESYFGTRGIEYSMLRVPIGGTDFSMRVYAYNEHPAGDAALKHFSLSPEDYLLKIPLVQAAAQAAPRPLRVVGSLWSPPPWMKDSGSFNSGFLKNEYYQTLADYFYKFIECYDKSGIPIWGVTASNEPSNGVMIPSNYNKLQWTTQGLGRWIQNNLGPTLKNSTFKHVKIIVGDDQRLTIPMWFNIVILFTPGALQYIDGVGVHAYFDKFTPAEQLTTALRDYPDKFILYTEASEVQRSSPALDCLLEKWKPALESINPVPMLSSAGLHYFSVTASADKKVDLGSWSRAENYASNIIEDLNHRVIGWLDWNLCVNTSGGPTWADIRLDAPIVVSAKKQEFYKQPMFYALGHFSKFVPRGSRRLNSRELSCDPELFHVAFRTPDDTAVVVMLNKGKSREVVLKLGEDEARIPVAARFIVTVELPLLSTPET